MNRIAATGLVLAALAAVPTSLWSATDPTYAALRAARPDGRRIDVTNLVLERDVFRFQFDSGAFHFLKPVADRNVGVVFVGQGSYRLSPATENERRQLALATGGDSTFETLTDDFNSLLLLFADDTAKEIQLQGAAVPGEPDAKALAAYEKYLKVQKKDFGVNFHARVVRDLLNKPNFFSGVFLALVEGKKYSPVLAAVDPDGAEALRVGVRLGSEDTILLVADPNRGGLWYHSHPQGEVQTGRYSPEKKLTDVIDYTVDTTIRADEEVSGTTTVRFKSLVAGLRAVPLFLESELRVEQGSYAVEGAGAEPAWAEVAVIQEDEKDDGDTTVVFPETLAKDSVVLLKLSYKGKEILIDGGDKNFYVGARASWYPNFGIFSDTALYDLTYRVPAGSEIVSVGKKVDEQTAGDQTVTRWKTGHPVQVAGFNYGKFKRVEKQDETSRIDVEVFTNPGTPDIIREINAAMSGAGIGSIESDDAGSPITELTGGLGESLGKVDTARLAETALADGLNSARLFTAYFGPLPQTHVAITQQSNPSFGQSWPSLIFMPYISFLDGTQRRRLGMGTQTSAFVDQVGYHEFAHQWWGHLVGAETYRDQWLEEGFSEFSSALAVQVVEGWAKHDSFWRARSKAILEKTPGNTMPPCEAGPITQGWRLSTQRTPSAGSLMYPKGGYVLHMLRMMMHEPGAKDADARFIAMMKDYTSTFGGKSASTADFQRVVERHMIPIMNATGDGKMDWFFKQWVYGTEIPRYTAQIKVEKAGDETRLVGSIKQEGVSKEFRAVVPIYLELDKGQYFRVGLIPMIGDSTTPIDTKLKLPRRPKRALINVHGDILARE
jgi:hypothetical protein